MAQDTSTLLLDEPTTFLDIAAQIDLLDLARDLNRREGRTIVMILHDLNLAARYADYLVAMTDGQVIAAGPPAEVLTVSLLRDVFAIEAAVRTDPRTGTPLILPIPRARRGEATGRGCPAGGGRGAFRLTRHSGTSGWYTTAIPDCSRPGAAVARGPSCADRRGGPDC